MGCVCGGRVRVDWFLCLQLSFFYPFHSFAVAGDTGTGRTPCSGKGAQDTLYREERSPEGLGRLQRGRVSQASGGTLEGLHSKGPWLPPPREGWACLNTTFPLSPSGAWGCVDADVAGVLGSVHGAGCTHSAE